MSNRFKGFNVEEPSSTRVDIPVPVGADPNRFGNIKEYKPNLIDRVGNLIPDTGVGGVLKGLYRGVDDGVFGLLPSGNYESSTPETKLGENMGHLADPFVIPLAGLKTAKYAVSGGTPISRLIANSIKPEAYSDKWSELKRVVTNPRALKEAAIDDIPQWVPSNPQMVDRVFAWRKKLGLGKPNERYNQALDQLRFLNYNIDKKNYYRAIGAELGVTKGKKVTKLTSGQYLKKMKDYEQDTPIDRLWDKFGKNPDGSYYYKKSKDFWDPMDSRYPIHTSNPKHGLFGGFNIKYRDKALDKSIIQSRDFKRQKLDYYDNWDFAFNRPIKQYAEEVEQSIYGQPKKVLLQRMLAELLTKPLIFKGTVKNWVNRR